MTTTTTFAPPNESAHVADLRASLADAESNVKQAWEQYTGRPGADASIYRTARGWVLTLRRELALSIAVDQGHTDWHVRWEVEALGRNERDALDHAEGIREPSAVEVTPPAPHVIPDPLPECHTCGERHLADGADHPLALHDGVVPLLCPVCGSAEFRYEEDEWIKRTGGAGSFDPFEGVGMLTMPSHYDVGDDGGNDDPGLVCESCGTALGLDDNVKLDWS